MLSSKAEKAVRRDKDATYTTSPQQGQHLLALRALEFGSQQNQ
jgi:hypothetical protein